MPNKPGTQHRSRRVSDDDWADLETATGTLGSDRGTVIKQFIRWYLRRPGGAAPPAARSGVLDGTRGRARRWLSAPHVAPPRTDGVRRAATSRDRRRPPRITAEQQKRD